MMINNWRTLFKQPSLPFVFILLTPYEDFQPSMWAAQHAALALKNVYAVTTVDVMDWNPLYEGFIHPRNKSVVGERASRWIQQRVWSNNVVAAGPTILAATAHLDTSDTLHVWMTLASGSGDAASNNYHIIATPSCTTCCNDSTGLLGLRLGTNARQYLPTISLSNGQLIATVSVRSGDVGAWRMSNQLLVDLEWFSYPQCALYDWSGLPAMPVSLTFPLTIDPPTSTATATPSFLLPLVVVFMLLAALSMFCFVYCWALRRHGRLCFCGFCDQCEGGCGRWCYETVGVGRAVVGARGGGSERSNGIKRGGGGSWRGMSDAEVLRQVTSDRYD